MSEAVTELAGTSAVDLSMEPGRRSTTSSSKVVPNPDLPFASRHACLCRDGDYREDAYDANRTMAGCPLRAVRKP